jgi:hypothetical protein
MRLMLVFTIALSVGVVSHFDAQYTMQVAAEKAEQAEAAAKSAKARDKFLSKYTESQKEKVMAMFASTHLSKVDRNCALTLIISYSMAKKHTKPMYEGCGFTASDFIAMGVAFPHGAN